MEFSQTLETDYAPYENNPAQKFRNGPQRLARRMEQGTPAEANLPVSSGIWKIDNSTGSGWTAYNHGSFPLCMDNDLCILSFGDRPQVAEATLSTANRQKNQTSAHTLPSLSINTFL